MTILLFSAGLVFLILGAEALVRGASRIATALSISPLVIGLTVVAYGTGAPEVAVSIKAAVSDSADVAVGNIIGSNIVNILVILGVSALIMPITVSHKLVRFDIPLLILTSFAVLFMSMNGNFSRGNGIILFSVLVIYTVYLIFNNAQEDVAEVEEYFGDTPGADASSIFRWLRDIVYIIVGIAALVLGAEWLVDGAVAFAQYLGISEVVIGLTIVSIGTSLPELVTSIVAGFRNENNIAVGNVVGSCLFNLMGVLGLSSIILPMGLDIPFSVISFDIPVMIAATFACMPIFFTGGEISRWEAALFLGYYAAYIIYLIMAVSHHDALPAFGVTMLYFVAPLTAITLFILAMQEYRKRKRRNK